MNQKNADVYDKLRQATPEELLEAAVTFYREFNPEGERWLRLGFKLAGSDGWEEVAPAWLSREKRNDGHQ